MSAVAALDRPLDVRRRGRASSVGMRAPSSLRTITPAKSGLAWEAFDLDVVPPGVVSRTSLRLTPRGRLVASLIVFATLAFVVLGWREQPVVTSAPRIVVVEQGQSLTDIAVRELPSMAVSDAIARIRFVNQMNSTDLLAGQRVLVPGLP